MNQKLRDIAAIKDSITSSGEMRFHFTYGRTGMVKCRMWHPDGFVMGSAGGGGYDKAGAALGEALVLLFAEELKALPLPTRGANGNPIGLYGLGEHNGKRYVDGACGMRSMENIIKALGFTSVETYSTGKNSQMLLARRA